MTSNTKQREQLATALMIFATELADGFVTDKTNWKSAQAEHQAASGTRREKLQELIRMTAEASESAACNLTPIQSAFIAVFQKEAWKKMGGKGEPDLSVAGSKGLTVISSQIKSILRAGNIAKLGVLTEFHIDGRGSQTEKFDGSAYLQAAASWRDLCDRSTVLRTAAVRGSIIPAEFGPTSGRKKGGPRKRTVALIAQATELVHSAFQSASDGRVLIGEALRCFQGTAPTEETRASIGQLTEVYLDRINALLEQPKKENPYTGKLEVNTHPTSAANINAGTPGIANNMVLTPDVLAALATLLHGQHNATTPQVTASVVIPAPVRAPLGGMTAAQAKAALNGQFQATGTIDEVTAKRSKRTRKAA